VLVLLLAHRVAAQPPETSEPQPQAIVNSWPIAYEAPEPCPKRAAFLAEIDARVMDSATSADVASISVTIVEGAGRFRGQLLMSDSTGDRSTRSVSGDDCNQVASALALITALALQAKLPSDEVPSEAAPQLGSEPVATDRESSEPEPAAPTPTEARAQLELGLHLGAASAYSPNPSATLRLFGGVRSPHFMLRLWLGYAASAPEDTPLGKAHFDLLSARSDICALVGDQAGLIGGLCGSFELGLLTANGESSSGLQAKSGGVLWAAPGVVGHLSYSLAQALRLEFSGGVQFPLYREQFIFRLVDGTSHEIHAVPSAGWLGSLGIAYVLP